jgi:hypothetical protein
MPTGLRAHLPPGPPPLRRRRRQVKVLSVYMSLPSAGEVAIAARRTKLSRVSDVRRGPITCRTVHTRSVWKVTNAHVVTVTFTQRDSHKDKQPEAWCRDNTSIRAVA